MKRHRAKKAKRPLSIALYERVHCRNREKEKRGKSAETYLSFGYFRQRRERESHGTSRFEHLRESRSPRNEGFDRAGTSFLAVTLPRDS